MTAHSHSHAWKHCTLLFTRYLCLWCRAKIKSILKTHSEEDNKNNVYTAVSTEDAFIALKTTKSRKSIYSHVDFEPRARQSTCRAAMTVCTENSRCTLSPSAIKTCSFQCQQTTGQYLLKTHTDRDTAPELLLLISFAAFLSYNNPSHHQFLVSFTYNACITQ